MILDAIGHLGRQPELVVQLRPQGRGLGDPALLLHAIAQPKQADLLVALGRLDLIVELSEQEADVPLVGDSGDHHARGLVPDELLRLDVEEDPGVGEAPRGSKALVEIVAMDLTAHVEVDDALGLARPLAAPVTDDDDLLNAIARGRGRLLLGAFELVEGSRCSVIPDGGEERCCSVWVSSCASNRWPVGTSGRHCPRPNTMS